MAAVPAVLVAEVAAAQWGVISTAQLRDCGVSTSSISRAVRAGHLHQLHSRVYAVGHPRICIEGRLVAALLYAGPESVLSHGTAAWWWRLTDRAPGVIHVTGPLDRTALPGLRIHRRRRWKACRYRRFPVTTVPQTLLDVAAAEPRQRLRRVLAEADYRRVLDPGAVEEILGPGRPGSAALRRGLADHLPALAFSRSEFEEAFLALCESAALELPRVNTIVAGLLVDMHWPGAGLVVELDGVDGHSSPAQLGRDHRRDLTLRETGLRVLRYTWAQITQEAERVVADLRPALEHHAAGPALEHHAAGPALQCPGPPPLQALTPAAPPA